MILSPFVTPVLMTMILSMRKSIFIYQTTTTKNGLVDRIMSIEILCRYLTEKSNQSDTEKADKDRRHDSEAHIKRASNTTNSRLNK
jgi:hypothetical protein